MCKLSVCVNFVTWLILIILVIAPFNHVNTDFYQNPLCGKSEGFANHRQQGRFRYWSRSSNRRKPKIIDGQISKPNSWPWQVSIELKIPTLGNVGHWCGGVLIQPTWILTAAHCVQNKLIQSRKGTENWTAVLGSGDRSQRMISLPIEDIYVHPNFVDYQNDIALLRIPWDLKLLKIAPICLPLSAKSRNETFLGINCMATGWGQTQMKGPLHDKLRQVQLTVVNNRHCHEMYSMKHNIEVNNQTQLCAGPVITGGKGTCIGDSGGPLQCNMEDGRWYLAGITSFGSGCAKAGYPDVFARLTHYVDWIQETILRHTLMFN